MTVLAARGYRCIAHDRRGHGRSEQPWDGNEMDTYADDRAALIEALDLRDAVLVGHSTPVQVAIRTAINDDRLTICRTCTFTIGATICRENTNAQAPFTHTARARRGPHRL